MVVSILLSCSRKCWSVAKSKKVDKTTWQSSDAVENIVNDSDSDKVKNVFEEKNTSIGGTMCKEKGEGVSQEHIDDTRKKVGVPPKKTGIWSDKNVDFDLLMKDDEKSILHDLQESDDDADLL
ncbi:hypothetical protein CTI12_AA606590 [Artemisia annua]|uniref:Uncharacterized protein n=1 Tax=Artemisia annua TaxID=35608 RepID=A0A2U1KG67_ARTAN|nr:hypothetical protein CTI12_AA606590 [Artemisia annua]